MCQDKSLDMDPIGGTSNSSNDANCSTSSVPPPPPSSSSSSPSRRIMKSTLSRGKLQFIKKSTRSTPWYDTAELLTVGTGLLTALQLFPMTNIEATTTTTTTTTTSEAVSSALGGGSINGGEVLATGRVGGISGESEGENYLRNSVGGVGQQQQLSFLSPADCHRLQHSLHRVAVWKGAGRGCTRIGGGESTGGGGGGGTVLPHAIESTACLAGILWADAMMMAGVSSTANISSLSTTTLSWLGEGQRVLGQDDDCGMGSLHYSGVMISLNQLRNAYSSAIIRAVNGLADSYRRLYSNSNNGVKTNGKSPPPPSVSHCACTLAGLPAWIVDVRHDASHGAALPTIHVCRLASLEILRYWKENYWSKIDERMWGGGGRVGGGEGGKEECYGMYTLAYDILNRYQTSAITELRRSSSSGGGGAHRPPTGSTTRDSGGQHRQQLQQYQQPRCVESSTSIPPASSSAGARVIGITSGMMEMERSDIEGNTNNSSEEGMMLGPSLVESIGQANDKCVDIGSRGNDTTIPHPTTRSTNNCRRRRPRQAESNGGGGGGAIPWWILADDDTPKKKQKKKKSEDAELFSTTKADENDTEIGTASATLTSPPVAPTPTSATTRDCAMEFIRALPMDIAFSTCLRFLVWGRTRTVGNGRQAVLAVDIHDKVGDKQLFIGGEEGFDNIGPALLTLPSDFVPHRSQRGEAVAAAAVEAEAEVEFDSLFEHLRILYEPLLIAMTTVYPGFAPALFVHLVDSILCLEEADDDESHDKNQQVGYMQYLSRWVRYILSRTFHMHFVRSVALFNPNEAVVQRLQQHHDHRRQAVIEASQQNLQQFSQASNCVEELMETPPPRPILLDLKKRGRKKWNISQLRYMQSPLDFPSLRDIGFPLNVACDRLLLFHQHRSSINSRQTTDSVVMRLHQYLHDVIGDKDRIPLMGICTYNNCCLGNDAPHDTIHYAVDSEGCSTTEGEGERERDEYQLGLVSKARLSSGGALIGSLKAQDYEQLLLLESERTDNMMSLEDMEAMFGWDVCKDSCIDSTCMNSPGKRRDAAQCPTRLMKEDFHAITPWTLCKSWDACAIGTMPGYPS